MTTTTSVPPTEAVIDLSTITANISTLCDIAGTAELMAVVKADGYGHGAAQTARAALDGGADIIGVATPAEAVALRMSGISAPIVAWLWPPDADIRPAVAAGVQLGITSRAHLAAVVAVAEDFPGLGIADYADIEPGRAAIHLKVDTGMGRNGVWPTDLGELLTDIVAAEKAGTVRLVGLMTHLACADEFDSEATAVTAAQTAVFSDAAAAVAAAGLRPRWQHIANTAATLTRPELRRDLVRCGIGIYGYPPVPTTAALRPAMTLRATVALTKRVAAGQGVGYGLEYHTVADTTLALIPLGYGDGIPRIAGNIGQVAMGGKRYRIAGRVAMDQIVIDCGDDDIKVGDNVIIFGPGDHGEPTATEWASWCGTIDYEIITRISPRVPRRYVNAPTAP